MECIKIGGILKVDMVAAYQPRLRPKGPYDQFLKCLFLGMYIVQWGEHSGGKMLASRDGKKRVTVLRWWNRRRIMKSCLSLMALKTRTWLFER